MRDYSLDQYQTKIQEAYSRFKAYVYYDNFNLTLRSQLASFESDESFYQKLDLLAKELFEYVNGARLSPRIQNMIENSTYIVLPKTFKNAEASQRKSNILISNQHDESYFVQKNTILFSGQIELQLIATFWIMEEGVKLNRMIGSDSYGYHLSLNSEGDHLGTEKLLFTKYFQKYQEWRDRGIKSAKHQIEQGNDVLLISLDIKNFFHSARIDFYALKQNLGGRDNNPLTSIIEDICIAHTHKIGLQQKLDSKPILPIGLVSSGVIANWLLSDFDKALKERMAPVYYGRYVDDFFIVVSNVKPRTEKSENTHEGDDKNTQTIEWLAARFFPEDTPLKIGQDGDEICLIFADKKYEGLRIQGSKLKLSYFSPDWPLAMLNKFQKTLEENSSAFWFLPEEEDLKGSLDDEAYDMHYEDTINKFRSVSDVKASKYGASVFLAKRIKLAILHSGAPDENVTKEIFRFFKGVSILSLYNMWEKVFSYMVVTDDLKSIEKLYRQIIRALSELKSNEEEDSLKSTLRRHLTVSLQMSFSLNPSCYNTLKKEGVFGDDDQEIVDGIKNIRFSLLSRHHYLPLPSLIITDYYLITLESLLSQGLFERLLGTNSSFIVNERLKNENWRLPRWYYLQEACMLYYLLELKQWKSDSKRTLFYETSIESTTKAVIYTDTYVSNCCSLFESLNNRRISKSVFAEHFKRYRDNNSIEPRIDSNKLTIKGKEKKLTLMLGLSNMRIEAHELKMAISKRSIITKEKRAKHIKLLNSAAEEKVELLILPETSVPIEWLYAYADESRRKERAFIFGLEHFTISGFCFNFSIALLPFEFGGMSEVFILPRLKNHYSPTETREIQKIGKEVPKPKTSFYHLINWKGLYFTIYNCYELTDVVHRSIFRSELDILFAIEYNKDTNYFSNIAESTCRDLHCYYVQANTSEFGDSRVVEPKVTEKMNPVRVKGGDNNIILKYQIDIQKLRDFQVQRMPYQADDKSYKSTPPDFDHDKVKGRT